MFVTRRTRLQILFLSTLLSVAGIASAQQGVLTGPFVQGSGYWTDVPNGGFETGDTSDWFSETASPGLGSTQASTALSYLGRYSACFTTLVGFDGPGYALAQNVNVVAGESYILSGFINTQQITTGGVSLDLQDYGPYAVPGGVNVTAMDGTSQWQFAFTEFVAPSSTVTARLVRDGDVQVGQSAYYDEVAITPASEFSAPHIAPVPELSSVVGFGTFVALGFIALLRRRKPNHDSA